MTTPTDDNRGLLTVVAYMRAAEGKTEELRATLESLITPTKRESGCVNYDLHQGLEDEQFFVFYENWESREHLEAHIAAPHLVDFVGKIPHLLDEKGLTIHQVHRIA